jgi:hypothetical protein
MDACEDGDVVLLLRGIHNGLGQACLVDKRILIRGEGALKEATVDCRSNVPLFRVTRPCVIQNVDVDFTGFSQVKFFTHRSVSTFDRVGPFQLTGEHFLYGIALRRFTSKAATPSTRSSRTAGSKPRATTGFASTAARGRRFETAT